ncbi:DUF3617 domain-containing protein [Sphingomonas lutea]|uniref:DUF3617 domain-containing protein n=1 Tax=Sphingomonas lutea TaxID=1045317 RepID=A0A7G9SK02_9SPHN|nr:DUF3617 domain-containing protein [Sphingomonas lutea]QNN68177.1 DUF3617 domain-containing protein [Sphingomonas lutea]
MKAAIFACSTALALTACDKGPEIREENASVAEVANKVADAGGATNFVRPGRWESTVTIEEMSIPGMPAEASREMRGMQGQEQTSVSCLTEAEAKRPREDFFAGNNKSCRYDRFTMADGKIDAVMKCSNEGGTQTMTMQGNYSPTTYNMTMTMQGEGAASAGMAMKMRVDARHRGQCTGDEGA